MKRGLTRLCILATILMSVSSFRLIAEDSPECKPMVKTFAQHQDSSYYKKYSDAVSGCKETLADLISAVQFNAAEAGYLECQVVKTHLNYQFYRYSSDHPGGLWFCTANALFKCS